MCERVLQEWDEFKLLIAELETMPLKEILIAEIIKRPCFVEMKNQLLIAEEDPAKDAALFIQ